MVEKALSENDFNILKNVVVDLKDLRLRSRAKTTVRRLAMQFIFPPVFFLHKGHLEHILKRNKIESSAQKIPNISARGLVIPMFAFVAFEMRGPACTSPSKIKKKTLIAHIA